MRPALTWFDRVVRFPAQNAAGFHSVSVRVARLDDANGTEWTVPGSLDALAYAESNLIANYLVCTAARPRLRQEHCLRSGVSAGWDTDRRGCWQSRPRVRRGRWGSVALPER